MDRPFTGDTFCSRSSLYAGQVGRDYGHGHNGSILRRSDLFHGSGCRIELDSADGLIRLMRGTDVRCPHCDQLEFNALAERAIIWFGLQKSPAHLVRWAPDQRRPQGCFLSGLRHDRA